jgi:O-antigen/teichoic acid export membrane protein
VPTVFRPAGRLLQFVRRGAGAAILAQALSAGGSFVLQVLAARALGASGYGRYTILVAVMVTVTAVHNGWLGDPLTVLDRHAADTRGALVTCLLASLSLGLVGGALIALPVAGADPRSSLLFGLLLAAWLLEETFRRLLQARLEFWKLIANDLTYLGVAVAVLTARQVSGGGLSLGWFLGAMTVGAAAAVLLGLVQLPAAEVRALRPGWAGLRTLAQFSAWSSGQAGLRPGALLLARLLVLHAVSAAAVGRLESARLLMAPVQTVIAGAGGFLLPTFAMAERQPSTTRVGRRRRHRRADRAVAALAVVTLAAGGLILILLGPLSQLVTGGRFEVSALAVLGWTVYLGSWAATLPYVSEALARRLSRSVFRARLIDSVVGVALAGLVLLLDRDLVDLVPWMLAVGGVVGAVMLRRLAVSSRTQSTEVRPAALRGR